MNARQRAKRLKIVREGLRLYLAVWRMNPWITEDHAVANALATFRTQSSIYDASHQQRHERRVFGHDVTACDCTREQVEAKVTWNQPPSMWGGMREYDRRRRARIRRGRA